MLRAKSGLFRGLNPTMAVTALTVLSVFLLFGVFAPDLSAQWFQGAKITLSAVLSGTTFWWYRSFCALHCI
ncbi:hypothetical protein PCI56_27645 [Plesiomonas shigelloides subsp. oncorhynchi]|nr:hypothetical protein [Plesiomonas shigelloides]